tara:strand:- start:92 stop:907 length:816 start_codon:yes stop_codon:yes gene_type:complete
MDNLINNLNTPLRFTRQWNLYQNTQDNRNFPRQNSSSNLNYSNFNMQNQTNQQNLINQQNQTNPQNPTNEQNLNNQQNPTSQQNPTNLTPNIILDSIRRTENILNNIPLNLRNINRENEVNETNNQNRNIENNETQTENENTINQNNIDETLTNNLRNRIRRVLPELVEITLYSDTAHNNANEGEMEDIEVPTDLGTLTNSTTVDLYQNINSSYDKCCICRETLNDTDIIRKINNCDHVFHLNCIDTWLSSNTMCPICRCDLRDQSNSNEE